MNADYSGPTTSACLTVRQRVGAYALAVLALVTCPCHLPIWIAVLAVTSAGAVVGEHWGLAALTLTALFVASVASTMRMLRRQA